MAVELARRSARVEGLYDLTRRILSGEFPGPPSGSSADVRKPRYLQPDLTAKGDDKRDFVPLDLRSDDRGFRIEVVALVVVRVEMLIETASQWAQTVCSAVMGSIIPLTSVIAFAGKFPRIACSRRVCSSGAM